MQYERSITSGLEIMAKVKVFAHASNTDADADSRAMTLAPRTYLSQLAKNKLQILYLADELSIFVSLPTHGAFGALLT